jgi:hypothetical protein
MDVNDALKRAVSVTPEQLAQIQDPRVALMIKSMLTLNNSLFEVFGSVPAQNVLPYAYAFENSNALTNAIPAGGTVQQSIKVTADAAFIVHHITGASTGDYLIDLRVDASDRILMNRQVHSASWVGTGERPHFLAKPLLVPPNSTLSFNITDLSGAVNEVYFTLNGFKIYTARAAG